MGKKHGWKTFRHPDDACISFFKLDEDNQNAVKRCNRWECIAWLNEYTEVIENCDGSISVCVENQ